MTKDRLHRCEALYEEAGIDVTFKVYDGVGHTPEPAFEDIVSFHKETVASYRKSAGSETSTSEPEGESDQEKSRGSAPRFGIMSGFAAIGSTGYILTRRVTDNPK